MIVISSAELRNNLKKYLDIAKSEQVLIQRGKNETFILSAQKNSLEYDLSRGLSVDEVVEKLKVGLAEMFERKELAKKEER